MLGLMSPATTILRGYEEQSKQQAEQAQAQANQVRVTQAGAQAGKREKTHLAGSLVAAGVIAAGPVHWPESALDNLVGCANP